MTPTTSSARTTRCPYCGRVLKARTVDLFGKPMFAGFETCDCPGAVAERDAEARAEAEAERRKKDAARLKAIRRAGILPRYEHASHPLALECAREMDGGKNLWIYGDTGTLKTELACASVIALVDAGRKPTFTAMWKILDSIKASFSGSVDPLPRYQTCPLLFLDDLGKEAPTDFCLERLFALVDERSARMLPTAITTQYKPSELISRLAKHGERETAVAIVSRLRQDCKTVQLTGPDRRIAK